jgi:hypothetical protein
MTKTIVIDKSAWEILLRAKAELAIKVGIEHPSHADAIRYLAGEFDKKVKK